MKIPTVIFTALLSGLSVFPTVAAETTSAHPGHVIENSELRTLPTKVAGRPDYQLHVGLPASYGRDKTRKYPVVFVTDAYWDFQKITAIRGSLVYDRVVPEFITVGLGYAGKDLNYGALRAWELSPAPFGANPAESGRASEFLQTIEKDIIPFIEREYRADSSYRVLAGASLGGLFTLYAMYTKPELFQGYVAATPAVVVGEDWIFGYDEQFAKNPKPLKVRLYASAGGNEDAGFVGGILRFNQRLASRNYQGLHYEFRIIDGERHSGMQLESYVRGLRFVLAPLAPETGPARAR